MSRKAINFYYSFEPLQSVT